MLARKKVLGNYNVGKTVGQGAFSKVKLGVHKETGQKVAIKIIDKKLMAQKAAKAKKAEEERRKKKEIELAKKEGRPPRLEPPPIAEKSGKSSGSEDAKSEEDNSSVKLGIAPDAPSFISSLQLEVQLMMRLNHPNIINLYSIMETEDECFVVMEFASGGELIEYIASRNYLSEREARKLFRQIISAMDHCHLANVVHRDLKLENLLLNENKDILISDFGLGRIYDPDTQDLLKTFCGTPNYAAVELISGIPYDGMKSDIWAMGVALYVMMTGRTPFSGATISQLYSKIKAVDYKCPEYFSGGMALDDGLCVYEALPDLKQLLGKMLKKDPSKRADMEALRSDPWVNFEEMERPLRIQPKLSGNASVAQITQFITSINRSTDYTIYTIRNHTRDGKSMDGAGEENNRSVQARRRSLSVQPAMKPSFATASPVRNRGPGGRRFSNAGNIIPVDDPSMTADDDDGLSPLSTTALSLRSYRSGSSGRRMSLQENSAPKVPALPNKVILAPITRDSPQSTESSANQTQEEPYQRGRRATITMEILDRSRAGRKIPSVDESPVESRNLSRRSSIDASANTSPRQKSVILKNNPDAADEDRDLLVIKRMSMVSPDRASFGVESCASGIFPTRLMTEEEDEDESEENESRSSKTTKPIKHITPCPSMPTDQEIQQWHEFHRPPKEIRNLRYSFNTKTTSTLAPNYIFQDVHRVLLSLQKTVDGKLSFRRPTDYYLIQCKLIMSDGDFVDFDIEVCKVWLLNLHGLRIKKQGGSALKFKEVYATIVDMLQIS